MNINSNLVWVEELRGVQVAMRYANIIVAASNERVDTTAQLGTYYNI